MFSSTGNQDEDQQGAGRAGSVKWLSEHERDKLLSRASSWVTAWKMPMSIITYSVKTEYDVTLHFRFNQSEN